MKKYRLTMGNVSVDCNHYEEAVRMAKPFAEKGISVTVIPFDVAKPIKKNKESDI